MNATDERAEFVTLVDQQDRTIGTIEKIKAHRDALLHRACSVVLFNDRGQMLLQKRNPAKYHSGGLWSNTCCTHPRPGESPVEAASRRLREEMGIETDLRFAFDFVYRSDFGDGLIEHEFDHVFVGRAEGPPHPNAEEVSDWRWATIEEIADDMERHPSRYTQWFPHLLERMRS
jgi:isopentenyl-diphosphate delta-isomerase